MVRPMKEKLVTVIMGVYNSQGKQLIRAVKSIEKQTYKNWEFIICDDGSSSEETISTLKKLSNVDSRIRILWNNKNKGLAYSLNYCISEAKGDYIARMDDDDVSLSTRLKKEICFLDNHPEYGFVSTNYYVVNNGIKYVREMNETPVSSSFLWTSPFLHPATVFRKKALLLVKGYSTKKETWRAEDYDLFMRMYSVGVYGYNIQQPLYKYYINNNSSKNQYIYRIYEAKIRFEDFRKLKISLFKTIIFSVKPLIVGLMPLNLLNMLKGRLKD